MSNYIVEAFKAMNLLESEDISLNADGYDKLQGFMDEAGVDPDEEMTDVFDLEAEAQDELKQSYIGKVVLECSVCHSDIFVDKSEVSVGTDEEGLACYDIECPYCMSNEGYTIIGEVAPFNAEESEKLQNPEDEEMPEVDVEGGVDDVDEEDLDESLQESKNYDRKGEYVFKKGADTPSGRFHDAQGSYTSFDGSDLPEDEKKELMGESANFNIHGEYVFRNGNENPVGRFHDADGSFSAFGDNTFTPEEDEEIQGLIHEALNEAAEPPLKGDGKEELFDNQEIRQNDNIEPDQRLEGSDDIRGPLHKTHVNEGLNDVYTVTLDVASEEDTPELVIKDLKTNCNMPNTIKAKVLDMSGPGGGWPLVEFVGPKEDLIAFTTEYINEDAAEFIKPLNESLQEGIEGATIETDDQTISLETGDDGSVSLNASPKDSFEGGDEFIEEPMAGGEFGGDEMIAPISDDSIDEVEAAADANSVEEGEENIEFEDMSEEPVDEFDMGFEDFDEESFNGLGESYLRECYENVTGFKTTGISVDDKKLMIEGIIKFDSGNIKETEFVFESLGNGKFEGYNKHISRGNKTYKLNTSVADKKLVCESLNYNYRSKNELNESVRVYGTVKRK